jgi:hypothetical protein
MAPGEHGASVLVLLLLHSANFEDRLLAIVRL